MRSFVWMCVGLVGCHAARPVGDRPVTDLPVSTPLDEECARPEVAPTGRLVAPLEPAPGDPEPQGTLVRGRAKGDVPGDRDFVIRVGIGFSPSELQVLEEAVRSWAVATGLPLRLRDGYGPLGNFHIAESIPVCGQQWVYDGYLGCYSPAFDSVVLNRHGLQRELEERPQLLYIVLVHEIGHFLGLSHAELGEDSVMLPDYPALLSRGDNLGALGHRDVEAACSLNPCPR